MSRHAHQSAATAFLAGAFACISLCWTALTLAQESSRQYDIDIGELPLTEALQAFSRQTGLQHGYLPTDEEEERMTVGPIQGRLTANEVLTKLLPSGFTFVWTNVRTVSIVSPPANVPPGGVKEAVAGKDQQRSELTEEQQLSMANGGGESGSARGPYAFDWRMTVEGQRIFDSVFDSLDLDIPVTVFDRGEIDALGVSTIVDLFRYVPQQPNLKPGSYLTDGTQVADLRGLGLDSTLVLINGRRTIPTASASLSNAFDLNNIPLGAVERIEIVSDSTSAIHGADAIGGVINIVLRKNIPEPRLDIDYGAAAGGAVERHGAFGVSGTADRAWGSIVIDYFDRSPLLGLERDRWSNQNFTRFGSVDWRSSTASLGNVSSVMGANLPGLPASFAAIPGTNSGVALTPADFVSTAGQRNLESLFRYYAVDYSGTRRGATAHGELRLTPRVLAFGEIMYVDREISTQFEPPALSNALVSAENPYNPFDEDVLVDALLTDLGPRTFTRATRLVRAAVGMRGRIREWDWEASLQSSQDDAITRRGGEVDPGRVAAALVASNSRDALNVFGSDAADNPQLLGSLLAQPARSRFSTEGRQSVVSARGPLAVLPAGILKLTVGGEWRDERLRYDIASPLNLAGSHQRSIAAAFGELRIPLVDEGASIRAVHNLALVVSGRLDDYSDVGRSFNPEYALIWRPVPTLTLRTSVAQSFRPPSLPDLYVPTVDAFVPIVDPARNGEFVVPVWRAGGNLDLGPSRADSLSVGLRFEPTEVPALRLGANYWRIAIDDPITIPSAARLLAAEHLFQDRIVRAPPTAADVAAGMPGVVQLIDITRVNFGSVRTSGVDANASVTLDTSIGRFKPELSATWVHDFTTSDLVDGMAVSRVGVANQQGAVPRWRAVATVGWSHRGWGLSGAVRHVPSYADVDFNGRPNRRTIASQTIVDLQLSVDLGERAGERSPWTGFVIRAGAFNLFDAEPPFAEVGVLAGFDTTQADLRQRFAYLKIAKTF